MTSECDSRLALVLDALAAAAEIQPGEAIHLRAYIAWMLSGSELAALMREAAQATGPARSYRHVAALGYAATQMGTSPSADAAPLREGLEWLAERNYFAPNRALGLEADGIALLGIALGVASLPADERREDLLGWLRDLLLRCIASAADSWDRGVMFAARITLGQNSGVADLALPSDLRVALAAKGVAEAPTDEDEDHALALILSLDHLLEDAARSATQLTALRWLIRTAPTVRPGRISVGDVVALLEGIQRSLRRWPWEDRAKTRKGEAVRWPINNEYHVQDLLWIILAPIFPDLEDEENLPSLGQKHPRYDLGIPSLKLIVEVKFVRTGSRRELSDVIEGVAADASLYLREPERYNQIIAFVWDNSGRHEEHHELRQGLLAITGVAGAVILSRPGKMT